MNQYGRWENMKWVWDVKLRRPFFNWELDQRNSFMLVLDSISVRVNIQDALAWSFSTNGIFSVSSFRRCLEDNCGWVPSVHSSFI